MIEPRYAVAPATLSTRGGELAESAEDLGAPFDDWQKLFCNAALGVNGDGHLAAEDAVLLVGRQCGKSQIGATYAYHFGKLGERVLYTGHQTAAATVVFERLLASIPGSVEIHVTRTNGRERIRFTESGGLIDFRTRSNLGSRGTTYDRLVLDEAQAVTTAARAALAPVVRTAGPDAQTLWLACSPNANTNPHAEALHDLRRRALNGKPANLVWFEWSADIRDFEGNELSATEIPPEALEDAELWRMATPASESGRIPFARMAAERNKLGDVDYAVEYLSVGVWPDVTGVGLGPVTLESWLDLVDEASEVNPDESVPQVVVGFHVNATWTGSIAVAGRRKDGLLHPDYVGTFAGLDAIVGAIEKIVGLDSTGIWAQAGDRDVLAVLADGTPENLLVFDRLDRDGVGGLGTDSAASAGKLACAAFKDLVSARRARHRGQREVTEALRTAVAKSLGDDAWAYSPGRSHGDISALMAVVLALWGADTQLPPPGEFLGIF